MDAERSNNKPQDKSLKWLLHIVTTLDVINKQFVSCICNISRPLSAFTVAATTTIKYVLVIFFSSKAKLPKESLKFASGKTTKLASTENKKKIGILFYKLLRFRLTKRTF